MSRIRGTENLLLQSKTANSNDGEMVLRRKILRRFVEEIFKRFVLRLFLFKSEIFNFSASHLPTFCLDLTFIF